MGKLLWILLLAFCLVAIEAKKKTVKESHVSDEEQAKASESEAVEENVKQEGGEEEEPQPEENGEDTGIIKDEEPTSADGATEEDKPKEFSCNLKFKKVGCYADNSKKNKPLKSFIMADSELAIKKGEFPSGKSFNTELPKFACRCANEAINSGNAIFGVQNILECWTGPDNSKYDKDGKSDDCVTFDYQKCENEDELCAGKKHTNYVYYIDAPEHTKGAEELQKERAAEKKKAKKEAKKKAAKKLKKKGKRAKKSE